MEETPSTSDNVDHSNNNLKFESVVETDDVQPDTVDDLHPLIDQEVLALLRNEDFLHDVEICENTNIGAEIGRY